MPSAVFLWIWFCAYLNCAGWALSALHELNAGGYAVALAIATGAFYIWKKTTSARIFSRTGLKKFSRRFRLPFPAAFLILAAIAILGGMLYSPNNPDELAYRFPRILHWLAEGQWHWIHTPDPRMNDRASGFEWLMVPLFVVTHSDRLFFLPNAVSFLLLPGLIYSVFIRLGISRKVAWHWMWLLPAGFNFALQAGSVANDLISVIFALLAMDSALRFGDSRRRIDLWTSMLAAGLMTGAKMSNLPLLLPWFGVLLFTFRAVLSKPLALLIAAVVAVLCSCLPNAVLNVSHGNDWTGSNLENPRFRIHNPLVGITGNVVVLGLTNFQLPIMPLSHSAGEKFAHRLIPQKFLDFYDEHFEGHFISFWGSGIQTEEGAGLGVAVWCLCLASAFAPLFRRRHLPGSVCRITGETLFRSKRILLLVLPWIALLVFLAIAGMGEQGRLLSPYYPLLVPLLLVSPFQKWIVRRCWWRWGVAMAYLMAGTLVVLTPARPLLPVQSLLQNCENIAFIARARASYVANAHRGKELGPVRILIPNEASAVGLVSIENEVSLWRPFGSHHVVHVLPGDTASDLRRLGVKYVVLASDTLTTRDQSIDNWLKEYDAEKVGQVTITRTLPPYVPCNWFVARLRP